MHTRRRFLAEALAPLIVATPAVAATRCIPIRSAADSFAKAGFVTPMVARVSFVSKMADGDLVRSPPIPA